MDRHSLILLTGGTGYVGGRLLQSLEDGGFRVRSMARRPEALRGRVRASTQVDFGDCINPETLNSA